MATRSFNKLPRVGRAAIKRSWQHLNSEKVVLQQNVKKLKVTVGPKTGLSFGARYFLYDKVPQLKFHNPDILFRKSDSKQSSIVVTLDDGTTETLDIQGKDADTILQYIREKFGVTDE